MLAILGIRYKNTLLIRTTSHMRLRAHDHYTSSTLIGGKGGAGPSSLLHTTFEGLVEYVNARWMSSLHGFLHGIEWIMFYGHLNYFRKSLLGGKSNTTLGDQGILNAYNRWFIGFVCRTETMHQLLYFKSKFPNHFAFTLGRYLILLLLV